MRRSLLLVLASLPLAGCPAGGSPVFGGLDSRPGPDEGEGDLHPDGSGDTGGRPDASELPPFELPPQDAPVGDPGLSDAGPDLSEADLPYPLCQPCRSDLECETAQGKAPCLEEGPDARTCGFPCKGAGDCPGGFDCVRNDQYGYQCRPLDGGACPCLARFVNAGFLTACWRENGLGRCTAERRCDQECPAPFPAAETCNGVDDDCDGLADQGLGTTTCGKGVCEVTVQNCVGGLPRECVPGTPKEEACNLLDDDCDGEVDEALPVLRCGEGACAVEVPSCIDGRPQPCWPLPPGVEACNGLDDDCDGKVDEDFGTATCGKGACARTVSTCGPGGTVECVPGDPVPETCNGLDDDCDGEVDQGLGEATCGQGACARTVPACKEGEAPACVPGTGTPEVCNGLDDDCDGTVDEDFVLGAPCDGPDADACVEGRVGCLADGSVGCVEPGTGHAEACNGADDDCDGQRDEGSVCPCPLVERDGHLYLFCTAKGRWLVARNTCAGWKYHLAAVGDAAENTWVVDTARAVSSDAWWIGLNDLAKEDTWVWVDGTAATYLPWGQDQPNNGGLWPNNQDCVLFLEPAWGADGRYQWNDAACGNDGNGGDMRNFVCEFP